jgi:hypothetical protein
MNQHTHPQSLSIKDKHKGKVFEAQMKVVFKEFERNPSTMLQVSFKHGILRANICRYVAKWRNSGQIAVVKKSYCPITKHLAGFYTTNPKLFPSSNQIKMF